MTEYCDHCGEPFEQSGVGRPRRYCERCSPSRRQQFSVRDWRLVKIPLGLTYVKHTGDNGSMIQRPLVLRHEVLRPENFDPDQYELEVPWAMELEGSCSCYSCRKPKTGQVTAGLYHVPRGQHVTIGYRRYLLAQGMSEDEVANFEAEFRVFAVPHSTDRDMYAAYLFSLDGKRITASSRYGVAIASSGGSLRERAVSEAVAESGRPLFGSYRFDASKALINAVKTLPDDEVKSFARRIIGLSEDAFGSSNPGGTFIGAMSKILLAGRNREEPDERIVKVLKYLSMPRGNKPVISAKSRTPAQDVLIPMIVNTYNSSRGPGFGKSGKHRLQMP